MTALGEPRAEILDLSMRAVVLAGGRYPTVALYRRAAKAPRAHWRLADSRNRRSTTGPRGFHARHASGQRQADIIRAYCGDGSKWGVNIDYSLERIALGTMGPLKLVRDLPDNFLVMNGDILSDVGYAAMLARHESFTRRPQRMATSGDRTRYIRREAV